MRHVHWLGELQSPQVQELGDGAGWLERLSLQGYPIPSAWVLSTFPMEQAIAAALADDSVDESWFETPQRISQLLSDYQQLQDLACALQKNLLSAELSSDCIASLKRVLEQSSAPLWRLHPSLVKPSLWMPPQEIADLWEPQLVKADLESILNGIRQLWASSFSAQQLLYWLSHNCSPQDIQFAVVAQAIEPVCCSGFLTINAEGFQIEAVWGTSLVITRGEAVPTIEAWGWDDSVLTQKVGHQTLAYSSALSLQSLDPSAQPLAQTSNPNSSAFIDAYCLSPELHLRSPISPELFQTLRQLGEQLWLDFQTLAVVEWVCTQPWIESTQVRLIGFYPTSQPTVKVVSAELPTGIPPSPVPAADLLNLDPFPSPSPITAKPTACTILRGTPASQGREAGFAWVVTAASEWPSTIPANCILVTPSLSPAEFSVLRNIKGVITEQGGVTSHSAILARELGIPAVVGVKAATQQLASGDWITLDGGLGEIWYGHDLQDPSFGNRVLPNVLQRPLQNVAKAPWPEHFDTHSDPCQRVTPPKQTHLLVNLSQVKSLERIQSLAVDGVGLLRSEFMMLDLFNQQHPLTWISNGQSHALMERLANRLQDFAQALDRRPIFYRFLDLNTLDEQSLGGTRESAKHPALKLRGALTYQYFPELLQIELSALRKVQSAGYDNLNVLVPFVRSVSEFQFCLNQIQNAGLLKTGKMQVWMMAEVPAVLFQLAEYQQAGVQGFSIGTNDLTHLLLGIDRHQGLHEGLDERHPAVQRAISTFIRQAQALELPCAICGDAPVLYPELIESLVTWGINAISVNINAVESTYRAILQAEQRLLR